MKKAFINFFKAKHQIDISNDITITVKLRVNLDCIDSIYPNNKIEDLLKRGLKKNRPYIITAYRDPDSYESYKDKREVGSTVYDIEKNTAFINILIQTKYI